MTSKPDRQPFVSRGRPAQYFERAAYAECLAALTPYGNKTAAQIAKEQWPDDAATPRLLTKGAVNPARVGISRRRSGFRRAANRGSSPRSIG